MSDTEYTVMIRIAMSARVAWIVVLGFVVVTLESPRRSHHMVM